jgi:hypothetical protein
MNNTPIANNTPVKDRRASGAAGTSFNGGWREASQSPYKRRESSAIHDLKLREEGELTFVPVTNDSIRRNIIRSVLSQ